MGGLGGALAGAGTGAAMTKAMGKTGIGGMIGGALGGSVGSLGGPIGIAIGSTLGGLLGGLFDSDIKPDIKELPEIEEEQLIELKSINKNLNTINDTMENLINAPANFVLPVPKGILDNSITAQSAIATPLQAGGLIVRSGPAYLHTGERVNRSGASGAEYNIQNAITINGANKDPKQIATEVMSEFNKMTFMQAQRVGAYRSRF